MEQIVRIGRKLSGQHPPLTRVIRTIDQMVASPGGLRRCCWWGWGGTAGGLPSRGDREHECQLQAAEACRLHQSLRSPSESENADISLSCPQPVDIVDWREAKGADVGVHSELGGLEALRN